MRNVLCLLFFFTVSGFASNMYTEKPRLVLQVTIDQLRGDIPERFYQRFSKGGLRYLMEKALILFTLIIFTPIPKPPPATRLSLPAQSLTVMASAPEHGGIMQRIKRCMLSPMKIIR